MKNQCWEPNGANMLQSRWDYSAHNRSGDHLSSLIVDNANRRINQMCIGFPPVFVLMSAQIQFQFRFYNTVASVLHDHIYSQPYFT